jgi:GNAT superfamily N-acetyltransferase
VPDAKVSPIFSVRTFRPGDETGMVELTKRNSSGDTGLERWGWIHKSNPVGTQPEDGHVWVAESRSGSIIGFMSRIVYRMRVLGVDCLGAQGVDLLTDKEFRGQGVGSGLISAAYTTEAGRGIRVYFAFPTKMSYSLQKRLGAEDVFRLRQFFFILNRDGYLESRYRPGLERAVGRLLIRRPNDVPTGGNYGFEFAHGFQDDAGTPWKSIENKIGVGIVRSTEYLRWRYNRLWGNYDVLTLLKNKESVGYAVYRWFGQGQSSRVYILELVARDDDVNIYEGLLDVVLEEARAKVSFIMISGQTTPGCIGALRRLGFRSFTNPVRRLRRGYSPRLISFSYSGLGSGKIAGAGWYCAVGDRDTA